MHLHLPSQHTDLGHMSSVVMRGKSRGVIHHKFVIRSPRSSHLQEIHSTAFGIVPNHARAGRKVLPLRLIGVSAATRMIGNQNNHPSPVTVVNAAREARWLGGVI